MKKFKFLRNKSYSFLKTLGFYGGLTSGITNIGSYAFGNNPLETVVIQNSQDNITIADNAFSSTTKMTFQT